MFASYWSDQNLGTGSYAAPSPRAAQSARRCPILGWPCGCDDAVVRGDPASGRFLVFALDGARIRAVIAFNSGRDMRPARRLIDTEVDVRRLADPSVELANI